MLTVSLYLVKSLIQCRAVEAPLIGQRYRGVEGRSGFLLRQAWQELRAAMELALREHRLTPAQYGALSVLARDPGLSGADLARATDISAQSMNGVLASLERGSTHLERTGRAPPGRCCAAPTPAGGYCPEPDSSTAWNPLRPSLTSDRRRMPAGIVARCRSRET